MVGGRAHRVGHLGAVAVLRGDFVVGVLLRSGFAHTLLAYAVNAAGGARERGACLCLCLCVWLRRLHVYPRIRVSMSACYAQGSAAILHTCLRIYIVSQLGAKPLCPHPPDPLNLISHRPWKGRMFHMLFVEAMT